MLALQNQSGTLEPEQIDKIIDAVLEHPEKNDILKQTTKRTTIL